MDPQGTDMAQLLERAKRLESKQLFVKAAEFYLQAGKEDMAASAYEKGGAFSDAEALFSKLGMIEDAARCKKAREEAQNPTTWDDLHAQFQAEKGNPD
jgi:hypothetical protein